MFAFQTLFLFALFTAEPLGPGDHTHAIVVDERERSFVIHVPQTYDAALPTPVVLAFHGAGMNAEMMIIMSGLNKKSDEAGFVVVYPNGSGIGPFQVWNAGGFSVDNNDRRPDDVAFVNRVLDEFGTLINVDTKRIYACGMSNGGMMSYRLAAELSDRIAAIAPVAGAIAVKESHPNRAVPVLHFHGTKDELVPFAASQRKSSWMRMMGVEESIQTWVKLNGCDEDPIEDVLSKEGDELKVTRKSYRGETNQSDVVLIVIEDGGHTWPGRKSLFKFLGKSAMNISANDLMWEFFEKHPMP